MENSAVFFYILIIVALTLKGVVDIVWKNKSKSITKTPPFDASQQPEQTFVKQKKKNKVRKEKPSHPIAIFAEGKRMEHQEYPSPISAIAEDKESPILKEDEPVFDIPTIQNADDLKKAIIYSEILNRKYN